MLKLGGREFDVIRSGTIEWDVTLLNLLQGCGLADVTLHEGESAEDLAMRVYRTLMSSGAVFEILGCVLTPHGSNPFEWTPELMRGTAKFIRALHNQTDKDEITSQINSLVAGFFVKGCSPFGLSRAIRRTKAPRRGRSPKTSRPRRPRSHARRMGLNGARARRIPARSDRGGPALLLREACIGYREKMLAAARAQYRHELTLWASIALHSSKKSDPPKPPAILREIVH